MVNYRDILQNASFESILDRVKISQSVNDEKFIQIKLHDFLKFTQNSDVNSDLINLIVNGWDVNKEQNIFTFQCICCLRQITLSSQDQLSEAVDFDNNHWAHCYFNQLSCLKSNKPSGQMIFLSLLKSLTKTTTWNTYDHEEIIKQTEAYVKTEIYDKLVELEDFSLENIELFDAFETKKQNLLKTLQANKHPQNILGKRITSNPNKNVLNIENQEQIKLKRVKMDEQSKVVKQVNQITIQKLLKTYDVSVDQVSQELKEQKDVNMTQAGNIQLIQNVILQESEDEEEIEDKPELIEKQEQETNPVEEEEVVEQDQNEQIQNQVDIDQTEQVVDQEEIKDNIEQTDKETDAQKQVELVIVEQQTLYKNDDDQTQVDEKDEVNEDKVEIDEEEEDLVEEHQDADEEMNEEQGGLDQEIIENSDQIQEQIVIADSILDADGDDLAIENQENQDIVDI
eukprot:403375805